MIDKQELDYLKLIASVIITSIILLIIMKIFLYPWDFHFCSEEKPSDIFMVILTATALIITICEYLQHRSREKAAVLATYNERYSKDKHINNVILFLISCIENKKAVKPSIHDVELFMRFFEEMELQIEEKRLNELSVERLFSYYVLYFDSKPELIKELGIDDYKKVCWCLFHSFVERMAKIRFAHNIWKCEDMNCNIIYFDKFGIITIHGRQLCYKYASGIITFEKEDVEIHFVVGNNNNDDKDCLVYEGKKYYEE